VKTVREFYERLKNGCIKDINNKTVVAAVHDSIMEIRSVYRKCSFL
jgi:hypothetical protein